MRGSGLWIERVAEDVERHVSQFKRRKDTITCASGMTPSGPVHMGILREMIITHSVAEELRARGWAVEHVHYWDDFDHLCKHAPAVSREFVEEHSGKPLSETPDPFGEYESYALRYMTEFERCLAQIGIHPRYVYQSRVYAGGAYRGHVKKAMEERFTIFDIIHRNVPVPCRTLQERRRRYYPFRVYCQTCRRDDTQIVHYNDASADLYYICGHCGCESGFCLDDKTDGKLVWKANWALRWSADDIDFEPAGQNHCEPGGSARVAARIAHEVYRCIPPHLLSFAFVGIPGKHKVSSTLGTPVMPATALDLVEPCILRWLFLRHEPDRHFTIDLGRGLFRFYSDWDAFSERVSLGQASKAEERLYQYSVGNSKARVATSTLRVSFRTLSSTATANQGDTKQTLQMISLQLKDSHPAETLIAYLNPRFTCAINWAAKYGCKKNDPYKGVQEPTHSAAHLKHFPLTPEHQRAVKLLLDNLDESWSPDGLADLIRNIPKMILGLRPDSAPTPEIKLAQRTFYQVLYALVCQSDRGPKLSTLFISMGKDRVRALLSLPFQTEKPACDHLMTQKTTPVHARSCPM